MSNACMWKNNPEIKFLRMNVLKVVPFICCSDYGKCSKISNTLKLRTPKIIVENNF